MITNDDIKKALNLLGDLTVDYGDRTAEQIAELDNAIDTIQMAAQGYENLGADNHKRFEQNERNKEYARGYAEARKDVETILEGQGVLFQTTDADLSALDVFTIKPKKGEPIEYEKAKRGFWEPIDREDYPLPHPMLVCSECQKTNHYPGKYCTYCGSNNRGDE